MSGKNTEYSRQQVEVWKQREEDRREKEPESSQSSVYDYEDSKHTPG